MKLIVFVSAILSLLFGSTASLAEERYRPGELEQNFGDLSVRYLRMQRSGPQGILLTLQLQNKSTQPMWVAVDGFDNATNRGYGRRGFCSAQFNNARLDDDQGREYELRSVPSIGTGCNQNDWTMLNSGHHVQATYRFELLNRPPVDNNPIQPSTRRNAPTLTLSASFLVAIPAGERGTSSSVVQLLFANMVP